MIETPSRFACGMALMMIGAALIAGAIGKTGFTGNGLYAAAVYGIVPMVLGAWLIRTSIKPPRD